MLARIVAFVGAVCVATPIFAATAAPECHIATPAAIGCVLAEDAAAAYERFGFDAKASQQSYIRALLHQAQCIVVDGPFKKFHLARFEKAKIPTPSGWVEVTHVDFDNGRYLLYFASKYISGDCPQFKPTACRGSDVNGRTQTVCN